MRKLVAAAAALALTACGSDGPPPDPLGDNLSRDARIAAVFAAPDRFDGDADRDVPRRSATVLDFSRIGPGDRVLELGSGGGYMARLLASLVGPQGAVTATDPQEWIDEYPTLVDSNAATEAAYPNVDHRVMEFDALEGAPGSYDAAVFSLIYHDTVWLEVDRAAMNRQIYNLLKPGGLYLVVDHHAEPGSGERDSQGLHRVDADLVRQEIEAAGFTLVDESSELENANDDLTLNVFAPEIRGETSRFLYLFAKPAS